jgi:hypothetical protein
VDTHIFEADLYFVPRRTSVSVCRWSSAAVTFKEYAFQDANTLEATQTQIGTRSSPNSRLCDQEDPASPPAQDGLGYVNRYKASLTNGNGSAKASPPPTRRITRMSKVAPRSSPTWSGSPMVPADRGGSGTTSG